MHLCLHEHLHVCTYIRTSAHAHAEGMPMPISIYVHAPMSTCMHAQQHPGHQAWSLCAYFHPHHGTHVCAYIYVYTHTHAFSYLLHLGRTSCNTLDTQARLAHGVRVHVHPSLVSHASLLRLVFVDVRFVASCMYVYVLDYVCVCIHWCPLRSQLYACVCSCVGICVCVCSCVGICVCVCSLMSAS